MELDESAPRILDCEIACRIFDIQFRQQNGAGLRLRGTLQSGAQLRSPTCRCASSRNGPDTQSGLFVLKQLLGKTPPLKSAFAGSGTRRPTPRRLVWMCFHWLLSIVETEGISVVCFDGFGGAYPNGANASIQGFHRPSERPRSRSDPPETVPLSPGTYSYPPTGTPAMRKVPSSPVVV